MDDVVINFADFSDAITLKTAVVKAAKDAGVDIFKILSYDLADVVRAFASIDISPEVNAAIWPCLARCTYKEEKITKKTFDDTEMWKLYYPIAIKCIEKNVADFFEGLLSMLAGLSSQMKEAFGIQKSPSPTM